MKNKTESLGKRTGVDFGQHELRVTKTGDLLIHDLKKPDTGIHRVKFINIENVLVVTDDFGNWIFCREFHPSKDGSVSDKYWCEKLQNSSTQNPYVFDADTAKEEIKEILEEDDGSLSEEEKEWLAELSDEADEGEYSYIAKAMDHPSSFDTENIPQGKKTNYWLLVVFDAFDEICKRLKAKEAENKESIRGESITRTPQHDAGAYGQCICGRYSDDPRCLDDGYLCECGQRNGFSGSFKPPTKDSQWSLKMAKRHRSSLEA